MKSFPPICIRKHSRITQNIARLQPFFLLIHNLEVSSFRNNFPLIRIWNHLLRQNPHPIHQRECFSVSMRIYNFRTLIIDHAHLKRFSFKKKRRITLLKRILLPKTYTLSLHIICTKHCKIAISYFPRICNLKIYQPFSKQFFSDLRWKTFAG